VASDFFVGTLDGWVSRSRLRCDGCERSEGVLAAAQYHQCRVVAGVVDSHARCCAVLGLTVDFVALSLVAYSRDAATEKNPALRRHNALRVTGAILSWAFLVYVAVVLALRPWNVQWVLVAKSATLRGAAAARSPSISDSEGEQSGRCSGNLAQKTSGLTTDLVLRKRQLTHHGILRGLPTST